MKSILLVLSLLALNACTPMPEPASANVEGFQAVRAYMSEQVETSEVPNAIGLVSKNGQIVFEAAMGQISDKQPAQLDTIVRLDSLTKPITAAAVLMLVDDGKLKLSDPVSKYIPAFENIRVGDGASIPTRSITIHDLLTHTAGLAGYSPEVDALWDSDSNLEFANGIAALPLRHNPGEGFQYGNAYEVLPAVVAQVSGLKFEEFVAARILRPLGMSDTSFIVPNNKRDRYSSLYSKNESGELVIMSKPSDPETEKFASGGGGLKSTVKDFHKFATMLMNKGRYDGREVLSAQAFDSMTKMQVNPNLPGAWQGARGWGYGMAVTYRAKEDEFRSIRSFGWNGGLGTMFFVDPEKKLIGIIFTQIHFSNPHELREGFERLVYRTVTG